MTRDRHSGDWAAWMAGPAAPAPSEVPGERSGSEPDDRPADRGAARPTAAPAADPGPADPRPADPRPADPGGDPRRSPRREATRQRILDAAREVFAERGVIGGTVEDICERAGFTRGAF